MARRCGSLVLVLATLALSACLDDPAVRDRFGGSPTPLPPSPAATAGAFPGEPDATPSPLASPSPSAGPGVTGRYVRTFDPLDLAIAGPGYFVLGTRPDPRDFSDLLFTRWGQFELVFVTSASPQPAGTPVAAQGEWRLMTSEGLYVLGFHYAGADGAPSPPETRAASYSSAFRSPGGATFGPLMVDSQYNLNFAPHFNFKGQLLTQGQPPLDAEGASRQMFVAIAQFENPAALRAKPGFPAYLYDLDVGIVSVGIAGITAAPAGVPRPVGQANLIRPETLER